MDVGVADSFVRKWVIFLQDIVILRKIKIHGIFGNFQRDYSVSRPWSLAFTSILMVPEELIHLPFSSASVQLVPIE